MSIKQEKTENKDELKITFTIEKEKFEEAQRTFKDKYGFEYTKSKLNTHLENAAQIQEIKTIILQ
jgi:hypothetical protein